MGVPVGSGQLAWAREKRPDMARDVAAEIPKSTRGKFGVGGKASFVLGANGMSA
jgi:hypothetical protein